MQIVKCERCDASYGEGQMNHAHELDMALERDLPLPSWMQGARDEMLRARGLPERGKAYTWTMPVEFMPSFRLPREDEEDC